MLKKLFKYEFRAMGRLLFPLYGATVLMGIISAVVFGFASELGDNSITIDSSNIIGGTIFMIVMIMQVMLTLSTIVFSYVFAIYRFKKNLLDSEGYLMNTLPVTTAQNIIAKLLAASIFEMLAIISVCLSWIVFTFSYTMTWKDFFDTVLMVFREWFSGITASDVLIIIEVIILILVAFIQSNLMFYASMSIGYSSNGRKMLKSVGMYVAFYMAAQVIGSIILGIISLSVGDMSSNAAGHVILTSSLLFSAAFSVGYWFLTNYFMKNKLNLQ